MIRFRDVPVPSASVVFYRFFLILIIWMIQIRLGDRQDTRGTAFVVYDDIYDAKAAVDHLSGFNVCGRYLIVLYYQASLTPSRFERRTGRR